MPFQPSSAGAGLKWHGKSFEKDLEKLIIKRMRGAGAFLRGQVVRSISRPFRIGGGAKGIKEAVKSGSNVQVRYAGGRRKRAGIPSKPGEPPKADTGRLRQSIIWKVDPKILELIVGTIVDYGFWLEVGTRNMAARPYLRPALKGNLNQLKKMIIDGKGSPADKKDEQ